ncbi:hypothetical protein AB6Q56_18380 [Dechloromonas sp. ARDL1]|uniref:hypothetical protein n=1 Tax=Dechloromonas sp. ARDL1 TaxID=3322121 RepID=UPI003DA6CF87
MKFRIFLGGLALVSLAACTAVPVSNLPESIANASSASDHQRIADFYMERAAKYEADAAWHEKAASIYYAQRPKGDPVAMREHCLALKERLNAAAKESRELAEAHRQLASTTK